jgi:hypothetical protein
MPYCRITGFHVNVLPGSNKINIHWRHFMKKTICMLILLTFAVPGMSYAGAYMLGNFGFGAPSDTTSSGNWSAGAEFGGIFLSSLHPTGGALSAGAGFAVSVPKSSNKVPSYNGKLPASMSGLVPTNDYYDGNEYEINACVGAELAPSFFLNLGAGYAWWNEDTVSDPILGTRYLVDSSSKNSVTGMIGLRYAIQGFMMGLGYHTRRGVVVSLGVAFN